MSHHRIVSGWGDSWPGRPAGTVRSRPYADIDGVRLEAAGERGPGGYFARWRIGGLHAGQGQWSCAAFSTVIAVAPAFKRLQPDW